MFQTIYLIFDICHNDNFLPVCTLDPICSSDILTDFPFSRLTLAEDGKQPGGGGGGTIE